MFYLYARSRLVINNDKRSERLNTKRIIIVSISAWHIPCCFASRYNVRTSDIRYPRIAGSSSRTEVKTVRELIGLLLGTICTTRVYCESDRR